MDTTRHNPVDGLCVDELAVGSVQVSGGQLADSRVHGLTTEGTPELVKLLREPRKAYRDEMAAPKDAADDADGPDDDV